MPSRKTVIAACALLLVQAVAIFGLSDGSPKTILSDVVQLGLGLLVVAACVQAARRSSALERSFWQTSGWAYSLWTIGQALATYSDLRDVSDFTLWLSNLFFCFWFIPFALILLLPPDGEKNAFNRLLFIDFLQAVLFCVAAYFYFLYLPRSESPIWLADSVRGPYFVVYGLVVIGFLARSAFSHSARVSKLFRRLGVALLISGIIDGCFYYGLIKPVIAGTWFDLVWSLLLIVPMVIAATWKPEEVPHPVLRTPPRARSLALMQLVPLFYPLAVLTMSAGMARQQVAWAATFVFLSFLCSTTRMLLTHHQLLESQEALRREATHDGLTGLHNRVAIIEILERELIRAQRDGRSVGVIMADVDHFKAVNDTAGHAGGDTVLRIVASDIAAGLRPYDSVGRYGGEEFLIVAPGCGLGETWELADRVRASIASCDLSVGSHRLSLSISMGISIGSGGSDVESLLRAADTALYQAKNGGRNRVEPRPVGSLTVSGASESRSF